MEHHLAATALAGGDIVLHGIEALLCACFEHEIVAFGEGEVFAVDYW